MYLCNKHICCIRRLFRRVTYSRFLFTKADGNVSETADESLNLWPVVPRNHDELIRFIERNIVWESRDFIATVKPSQIAAFGKKWRVVRREEAKRLNNPRFFTMNFGHRLNEEAAMLDNMEDQNDEEENDEEEYSEKDHAPTVASVIPALAAKFNCEKLAIAKTVPRYYEGPMLLAKTEKGLMDLRTCFTRIYQHNFLNTRLLCFCVGNPTPPEGEGWCYSRVEMVNDTYIFTLSNPEPEPSRRSMLRGVVKRGFFQYRVLAADKDCSLVELAFNKMQYRLERLFLLDRYCPMLGDNLCQKQIAKVLNRPVLISPKNASVKNQFIPLELLKTLRLSLKDYHRLPMFGHVHTFTFPKLLQTEKGRKKRADLIIHAPFPPHFKYLLEQFGWTTLVKEYFEAEDNEKNDMGSEKKILEK